MNSPKKSQIFAFLCVLNLNSWAISEENWKLKKSTHNIQTYVGDVKGSKYKAARHVTLINTTIESILKAVIHGDGCKPWLSVCISGKLIDQVSDNEFLGYAVIDMPWPISNRDLVYRSKTSLHDSGTIQIDQISEPNSYPASNWVRMVSKNTYLLEPINKNQVRFTWTIHSNPGGNVPVSLVNSKIHKNTRKDLLSLLNLLAHDNKP